MKLGAISKLVRNQYGISVSGKLSDLEIKVNFSIFHCGFFFIPDIQLSLMTLRVHGKNTRMILQSQKAWSESGKKKFHLLVVLAFNPKNVNIFKVTNKKQKSNTKSLFKTDYKTQSMKMLSFEQINLIYPVFYYCIPTWIALLS